MKNMLKPKYNSSPDQRVYVLILLNLSLYGNKNPSSWIPTNYYICDWTECI